MRPAEDLPNPDQRGMLVVDLTPQGQFGQRQGSDLLSEASHSPIVDDRGSADQFVAGVAFAHSR